MKHGSWYVLLATKMFFLSSMVDAKNCKGKAYYSLTFNAEWSNETHPSPVFPTNATFSPLIGATHDMYYEMWRRGRMASPGVQLVAETGKENFYIFHFCYILLPIPSST